ncbi:MAG: zf-HC2 domain-containing protein [Deinococcus sp.]|nr:zf-HC2 domain-containing protein [Deinococcus sp.]
MNCRHGYALSQYLDGRLDAATAQQVEEHLAQSAECRAELTALLGAEQLLRTGFQTLFAELQPRPGLAGRVLAAAPAAPQRRLVRRWLTLVPAVATVALAVSTVQLYRENRFLERSLLATQEQNAADQDQLAQPPATPSSPTGAGEQAVMGRETSTPADTEKAPDQGTLAAEAPAPAATSEQPEPGSEGYAPQEEIAQAAHPSSALPEAAPPSDDTTLGQRARDEADRTSAVAPSSRGTSRRSARSSLGLTGRTSAPASEQPLTSPSGAGSTAQALEVVEVVQANLVRQADSPPLLVLVLSNGEVVSFELPPIQPGSPLTLQPAR